MFCSPGLVNHYCFTLSNRPTQVKASGKIVDLSPKIADDKNLKSRLLKGFEIPTTDDYLTSRIPVLVNNDCYISLAAPKKSLRSYFYRCRIRWQKIGSILIRIRNTGRPPSS